MAHIVVIDDDDQFREMLVRMLTQNGHRLSFAHNGEEGLLMSKDLMPDLIITDILMPHMDGIELIMKLDQLALGIPIIAISGGRRSITADFNLESATMMGVKATLAKPFSRDELNKAIEHVLGETYDG